MEKSERHPRQRGAVIYSATLMCLGDHRDPLSLSLSLSLCSFREDCRLHSPNFLQISSLAAPATNGTYESIISRCSLDDASFALSLVALGLFDALDACMPVIVHVPNKKSVPESGRSSRGNVRCYSASSFPLGLQSRPAIGEGGGRGGERER